MGKKKKTKERKGKKPRSKSKHKNIQVWKMYESGKIKGKWCPRCGPGVLLAQHKDRITCGKCGYSEMKVENK